MRSSETFVSLVLVLLSGLMMVIPGQVHGGWDMESPPPTSNSLSGIWGSSTKNVYAVGGSDTTLDYPSSCLAAASPSLGLWLFCNGAWTQLSTLAPNHMVSDGNKLFADFPLFGLFEYDGATWTKISTNKSIEGLVAVPGGILYADFGTSGLFKYINGVWSSIASISPNKMTSNGDNLLANFLGFGLFEHDGNSSIWSWLSPYDGVQDMFAISGTVYGDAGTLGLWKYDGAWTCLTPANPNKIQKYGGKLVANFPEYGLFEYDGSNWTSRLASYGGVKDMIGVSDSLYADFGDLGLWHYSSGFWTGIAPLPTNRLGSYGKKLVASFAGWGLFEYDGSNWTFLAPCSDVTQMVEVKLP
jgi:hypothetical protein